MLLDKSQTGSKYRPTGLPKKCKPRVRHLGITRILSYFFSQSFLGRAYFQISVFIQQILILREGNLFIVVTKTKHIVIWLYLDIAKLNKLHMYNFLPLQRNTGEMSSNLTSLALVRSSSSTRSTKSSTDKSLSVNSLSRDILTNFPHSVAMQKRILVNLRIVEYKLAELEQFLVTKGLNGALVNRKSTDELTECDDSGGSY